MAGFITTYSRALSGSRPTYGCNTCYRKALAVNRRSASRAQGYDERAPATPVEIQNALENLMKASLDLIGVSEEDVRASKLNSYIEKVEDLAVESGMNRIYLPDNDGEFLGTPLTGRTAARTNGPLPLGVMSFGVFEPANYMVDVLPAREVWEDGSDKAHIEPPAVFKGKGYGYDQAYVLSTQFRVPESSVRGVSRAIGYYEVAEVDQGPPRRLNVTFTKMRLEPLLPMCETDADKEAAMQTWLTTFAEHNPSMDLVTGVLGTDLPTPFPGWQDFLFMSNEWQLVLGNAGSKTLLRKRLSSLKV